MTQGDPPWGFLIEGLFPFIARLLLVSQICYEQ